MRKIYSIIFILLFVLCTGCGEKQNMSISTDDTVKSTVPPKPDTLDLPVITGDYYIDRLENAGITVEYQNIVRTGYHFATADLVMTASDGRELTVNIKANIDQYKETEDSYTIPAIFPGNVQIYGDEAIVTTADKVLLVSLEDMSLSETELDISTLEDISGIAVTAVKHGGGYAVLYYSPSQDGVLLYNERGRFLENKVFEMPEWKIPSKYRNDWLMATYEDFTTIQQLRYTYMYPIGENSDMLMIHTFEKWPRELLYDISNNMLYGCQNSDELVSENSYEYHFYEFNTNTGVDGRTFNTDHIYLAERKENNVSEYMLFQLPMAESVMYGFQLSEDSNENQLIITHEATRREITVDFEKETIDKKFNIPGSLEDYRNGRLRVYDISPSGRYVLYIFDSFIPGSHTIYELALLDTYTGKTKFVCENHSQLRGPWGETGFLSDSEIYNFDYDYRIYSTDMDSYDYKFRLSEHFPLGHYKDESGDTIIHYAFEFARLDNGNYVVVYCHFPYGTGKASDYTYLVSLLDSTGEIITTYDTGVYLPSDWLLECEIYLEFENGLMNINAYDYGDTDESTLLNGTFNLDTGEFIYIAPEYYFF